jgi:hypothetical protein
VLIAAALVLTLTQDVPVVGDDDITPDEPLRITFTDFDEEDVAKIHVKNALGEEYTIERIPAGVLDIPLLLGAPRDDLRLSNAARYTSLFTARGIVEEDAEDLEKYGLGEGAARFKAEFVSGGSIEFYIGNLVPGSEPTAYVREAGSNTVYEVWNYLVRQFREEGLYYYASLTLTPDYMEAGAPDLEKLIINVEGKETHVIENIPVSEDNISNTHRFTEPIKAELDFIKGEKLILGLFGLRAREVFHIGEELPDDSVTGFGSPTAVVRMTADGHESALIIGDMIPGSYIDEATGLTVEYYGYYGVYSDIPGAVYIFNPTELPWLNIELENLISAYFLRPMIYTVAELTLEKGSQVLNFRLTGEGRDDEEYFLDGEIVDAVSFKDLYRYLISARAEGLFSGEGTEDAELLARYTFRFKNGDLPDEVVEFYASDIAGQCIIAVGGEAVFTGHMTYITRLGQNIEAFLNGGEIIFEF